MPKIGLSRLPGMLTLNPECLPLIALLTAFAGGRQYDFALAGSLCGSPPLRRWHVGCTSAAWGATARRGPTLLCPFPEGHST